MDVLEMSVLVIESHPLMREALCAAILAEPGWGVAAQTANSAEACRMAEQLHPDIILFALEKPGWNDLKALSALRNALPEIPIVALYSDEAPEHRQAAARSGASTILTKSAPRSEFIRALHDLYDLNHKMA